MDYARQQFMEWAARRLQSQGIDPQTVDTYAFYDSNIKYKENKDAFSVAYPASLEQQYGRNAARGEKEKQYQERAEQFREMTEQEREEKKKLVEEQMAKGIKPRRGLEHAESPELEETGARKKEGGISTLINQAQAAYSDWQEKRETGRAVRAKSRFQQLQRELSTRRTEHVNRNLEAERKRYEGEGRSRMMGMIGMGGTQATSKYEELGARKLIFGGGSNEYGAGKLLLGSGGGGMARELLLGRQGTERKRGHYVTVVEHGRARRVYIGEQGEQQYGAPRAQEQKNGMAAMLEGRGSMNFDQPRSSITGISEHRSNLQLTSGRSIGLSNSGLQGISTSRLSLGGGKKLTAISGRGLLGGRKR